MMKNKCEQSENRWIDAHDPSTGLFGSVFARNESLAMRKPIFELPLVGQLSTWVAQLSMSLPNVVVIVSVILD